MRQKGIILLPVIITILLVGALGYFVFQNFQSKDNYKNLELPTVVPNTDSPKSSSITEKDSNKCDAETVYVRFKHNEYACIDKETLENTSNWKLFTSEKNYTIKYPDTGIAYTENYDFHRCIYGELFLGGCVAIEILSNKNNIPLNELGNQRYATDAPELYDLNWKETTFKGEEALTTEYSPPGDSVPMTIYIVKRNNTIYSIWSGYIDESNSSLYQELTEKILSTFKFTS